LVLVSVKVRVISPHLDDGAWSAAGILERHDAVLVTICAGVPPPGLTGTQFDQRAGFDEAHDAMIARRREDVAATEVLGCRAVHRDLLDVGYALAEPLEEAVAKEVLTARENGEVVVGPLGLRHPDHQTIATAFRRAAREWAKDAWIYEDLPYAYAWPEYLAPALHLAACGEETVTRPSRNGKERAIDCYHSQIRGAHRDAIMAPERYHRLCGTAEL
jgi:LmbE family N-acetylglucosaminyl deacetylase